MKPNTFMTFTWWEQRVSHDKEYGDRPYFWSPEEVFKCASVLCCSSYPQSALL